MGGLLGGRGRGGGEGMGQRVCCPPSETIGKACPLPPPPPPLPTPICRHWCIYKHVKTEEEEEEEEEKEEKKEKKKEKKKHCETRQFKHVYISLTILGK